MSNGKRRYFPGANTGRGFIGHFEGIVPPWSEPHYTYVLKGGPGVGKSTLMKKCAAIARANGFTVEEFRCASDPESFDAVRIPQRRLVLLDGTAPHTIDPAMPGIDGETLDLGRFLHKEVFKRRREELFVLAEENRAHYKNAFACLSAAGSLRRAAVSEAARSADLTMIRTFFKRGFHTAEGRHTAHTIFNEPHARRRCGFPGSTGCRKHRVPARRFGCGVLKRSHEARAEYAD